MNTSVDKPAGRGTTIVFYDGHCGLCHGFVLFLLRRDADGSRFQYAPLQGSTLKELVSEENRVGLPDSIVVMKPEGGLLIRSSAVLFTLGKLHVGWRICSAILSIVPRVLSDMVYRGVARVRKKIFRTPPGVCPLVPPELAGRFLP